MGEVAHAESDRYPREVLDENYDDGTMPASLDALTIEDAKVLEIPEISAYYLLAQIAGQDTTQSIPELLSQFEAWHILAETTLSKMEKN